MFCCCVGENILFNIRNYAWHIKESWLAWMHLNSLSWQFVLLMRCYWEWKPFCRIASSAILQGNESPPSLGLQDLPFPLSHGREPLTRAETAIGALLEGPVLPCTCTSWVWGGEKATLGAKCTHLPSTVTQNRVFQVLEVFYAAFISIIMNYISLIRICTMPYFLPNPSCFQLLLSYDTLGFITK